MLVEHANNIAEAKQKFIDILSRKNFSNAFLVSAPKGSGKAEFVEDVVRKTLLSDALYQSNVLWVKSNKEKILINQVRDIYDFLSKTSYNDTPRIIVIDSADSLNIQSSNALLKILEDCNSNSYFILISHNPSSILKTVRSRCINIKVPFDPAFAKEFDIDFYHEILSVVGSFNTDINVLYKFIDKYFTKDTSETKWPEFIMLMEHFMSKMLKFKMCESSRVIEQEFLVVEKTYNLRTIEEWNKVFSEVRTLMHQAELCSLSLYNVVFITFFKIMSEKNV